MRGHTRCLTLQRKDDYLVATASLQCGFVPMRGDGSDPTRRVPLRGDDAVLILDDPTTRVSADALRTALDGRRVELWSPVTLAMSMGTSFEALHLFLASQPRSYGILTVNRERTAGLLDPQDTFFCPTLLTGDSFAYLTLRRHDDQTWQFGAHGFGPTATTLAGDLIDLVTIWDDTGQLRLLVPRRHRLIAITWPKSRL
jgi:protein-L-isoaspartate(D-aspartate) O-methyltransferase